MKQPLASSFRPQLCVVRLIGLIGALLAAIFSANSAAATVPPVRDMNILMIVAEDWSSFALGCYGNPTKKYVDLYDPAKMPLSPAARDKDRVVPWKQATFACIPIKGLGRSVRTKDFRYAEWRSNTTLPGATPADARELYDLVNDPLEQTNLVSNPLFNAVLREHEALLRAGPPAARASRAAAR